MATESLQEFFDSRGAELTVDREAGVIRGVKILGAKSRNGRTYLKETMARAVGKYEGAKVNVNHPGGKPDNPRNYQDRMGVIRNARLTEGDSGLFGDFHANPKHPMWEQLAWDAEHAPENVGFSHNVRARTSRRGDEVVVEEITHVQSVDLVADPATTRGLFEHQANTPNEEEDNVDKLTLEQLQSDRPDLVSTIGRNALQEQANSQDAKAAIAKTAELEKTIQEQTVKLDGYESAAKLREQEEAKAKEIVALKETIDKEVTDAKLPETLDTPIFRESLLHADGAEARKALLEDRLNLVPKPASKPQSKEQHALPEGDVSGVTDAESFLEAIT